MSLPTRFPSSQFFYPFGNTPARFLTENQPISTVTSHGDDEEQKKAIAILSLGNGDMRSVYYTIQCHATLEERRHLDFTLNDIEPAVLARNILFSVLFMDMAKQDPQNMSDQHYCRIMWSLHYNQFVDRDALNLLISTAERLLAAGTTVGEWHQSEFGT